MPEGNLPSLPPDSFTETQSCKFVSQQRLGQTSGQQRAEESQEEVSGRGGGEGGRDGGVGGGWGDARTKQEARQE